MPETPEDVLVRQLGQLLNNLLSLELLLRLYITRRDGEEHLTPNLLTISEGDVVHLTTLTNYDQLSHLIKKFNGYKDVEFKVDGSQLTKMRHALAHGRIVSNSVGGVYRIFKFKEPRNGQTTVKVDTVVELSPATMTKFIGLTNAIILTLHNLCTALEASP